MANITFKDGTDSIQWKIIESIEKNTNVLKLDVPFSTNIAIGDIITLTDSSDSPLFKGKVQEIRIAGVKSVEVYDLGAELLERTVNKIYNNQSPEAIIQDVLTNFATSLTYVSSINSGETISVYAAKDKRAWDVVNEMADILLAIIDIDENGNFNLKLKGDTLSSKSISSDSGATIDGSWKQDKSQLVNSVIVKGDRQQFETLESFNGDGTTTEFEVINVPKDLKVSVGGTLQSGYVPGQGSGDYIVERENKKIIFDVAPVSGSGNVVIEYTYEIPVKVQRRNKGSIETYGEHNKVVEESYIRSRDQARNIAANYLEKFSSPLFSSKWYITNSTEISDFKSYSPGDIIVVTDNVYNVSGEFLILKSERDSNGQFIVTVGEEPETFVEYNKEVVRRIKQLEEKDDNSTLINFDEFASNNIGISFNVDISQSKKRIFVDNTFYLERDPNGTFNQMVRGGTGPVMRRKINQYTEENLF